MTPLEKPLKRAIRINGTDFVVTLTPLSLKVTRKGRRLGLELPWESLVNGESALAAALQASVGHFESNNNPQEARFSVPQKNASVRKSEPAKAESRKRRAKKRSSR